MQKSYARATHLSGYNEIVTVTNRDLFYQSTNEASKAVPSTFKKTFLCEPERRNTTASIALASHYAASEYGDDCTILVLPADHLINDLPAFSQALKHAEELADQSQLVTFGIKPSSPKTGYGYILADGNRVDKFVEKPDRQTAEEYIANGNYLWNSGIYCMRASSFLSELSLLAPDIAEQTLKAVSRAKRSYENNIQQFEIQPTDFEHIQNISVDYAVFEKSQNIAVVPCDIGWSDVGSWNDLGSMLQSDKYKNNISDNVICKESNDCIIHGNERLIATYGVKNLIISDTADALLVVHKDNAQDIPSIIDELKIRNDSSYKESQTVSRPWGTYTVLHEADGFKIKRIEVNPGGCLSLQIHQHRSEHWVVISGKATVINGDHEINLEENQSTFIPPRQKHRLSNSTNKPLVLIEVQTGNYLGEDDIERFEDIYSR
jgi:mannose-1-phosphate guanylyltransferase